MRAFLESFRIYSQYLHLILPFALFGLLSTIIVLFAPYPTFFSMGGLFLRAHVAGELTLSDLAVSFLLILLGSLLASLMFILISNVVYASLTKSKITTLLHERVERYTGRLFLYFLSIPAFSLFFQLLALYFGWEWLPILGLFLYSYLTFFLPYALAVEDLSWRKAVKKALYLMRRYGEIPIFWALVVAVGLFLSTAVIYLLVNEWAGLLSFLFNTLFLLPYSIVLASVLYVRRYPIVG